MRHDWIFDVLSDLLDYAARNDLPLLALKVGEALEAARHDMAMEDEAPGQAVLLNRRAH